MKTTNPKLPNEQDSQPCEVCGKSCKYGDSGCLFYSDGQIGQLGGNVIMDTSHVVHDRCKRYHPRWMPEGIYRDILKAGGVEL